MSYMKEQLLKEYDRIKDLVPDMPEEDAWAKAEQAVNDHLADIADMLKERAKYEKF